MRVLATRREPLVYGVMLGALFLAVYGPLVPGLVRDWSSHPMLSQGFAIPVIAAVQFVFTLALVRAASRA